MQGVRSGESKMGNEQGKQRGQKPSKQLPRASEQLHPCNMPLSNVPVHPQLFHGVSTYMRAEQYMGYHKGYVFKTGEQGTGYYLDIVPYDNSAYG